MANWKDFSEKAGAFLSGASNVIPDMGRYPLLGANYIAEKSQWVSPETASQVRKAINTSADNPIFYSDNLNKYRNYISDKHTGYSTVGNIAAGSLAGGMFGNMGKVGRKGSFEDLIPHLSSYSIPKGTYAYTGAAGVEDRFGTIETMKNWLRNQISGEN